MSKKGKGKKGRRHMPKAHVGVSAGLAATGYSVLWGDDAIPGGLASPVMCIIGDAPAGYTMSDRVNMAVRALKIKAVQLDNYKPLVVGAVISAAPRVPVVSMVARPVENAIVKMTRGKWRL